MYNTKQDIHKHNKTYTINKNNNYTTNKTYTNRYPKQANKYKQNKTYTKQHTRTNKLYIFRNNKIYNPIHDIYKHKTYTINKNQQVYKHKTYTKLYKRTNIYNTNQDIYKTRHIYILNTNYSNQKHNIYKHTRHIP